jgi:hypothetical protein
MYFFNTARVMAYREDISGNEEQDTGENFYTARKGKTFPYMQALTILLLLIQSLFVIRLWSANHTCSTSTPHHKGLIQRKWHRNTSYMSLDHAYDGLWNETGQSALVFDDEKKDVVQITMQVKLLSPSMLLHYHTP